MISTLKEEILVEMMESLENCGLSEELLDIAKGYLKGEMNACNLGLEMKRMNKDSDYSAHNANYESYYKMLQKLEEPELASRYFSLLLVIYGVDILKLFLRTSKLHSRFTADVKIAMIATQLGSVANRAIPVRYEDIYAVTDNRDDMVRALHYTQNQDFMASFTILSTMFYGGKEELLDCYTPNEWVRRYPEEFRRYEEMIPEVLCTLVDGGFTEESKEILRDFLLYAKNANEVAGAIVAAVSEAPLNDPLAKLLIGVSVLNYRLSPVMHRMLGVLLAGAHMEHILDIMQTRSFRNDMETEMIHWYHDFALDDQRFIAWLVKHASKVTAYVPMPAEGKLLREMVRLAPNAFLEVVDMADISALDNLIKVGNDTGDSHSHQNMKKHIQQRVSRLLIPEADPVLKAKVEAVLTGQVQLEDLHEFETELSKISTEQGLNEILLLYSEVYGQDDFYKNSMEFYAYCHKKTLIPDQQTLIGELILDLTPDLQAKIEAFLTGRARIETLYGFEKDMYKWRKHLDIINILMAYRDKYIQDDFYNRCVAVIGIRYMRMSLSALFNIQSRQGLMELMRAMRKAGLDISHRIKLAEFVIEDYSHSASSIIFQAFSEVTALCLEENREDTIKAFLNASLDMKIWGLKILAKDCAKNQKDIFRFFSDKTKLVREWLVDFCFAHEEWLGDIIAILRDSKKSVEWEIAEAILEKYASNRNLLEKLQEIIIKEKSADVICIVKKILRNAGVEMDEDDVPITVEDFIKHCHRGEKKRGLAWISKQSTEAFPIVHIVKPVALNGGNHENGDAAHVEMQENGEVASEEYMQAILLAYAGMPVPGLNPDVHILTGGLNKQELATYMNRVYDVFLEDGGEAKNKWVLYAVSIHGGMEIALKLKHQIDEWAENSRGVMAAEAVKALALNENPLALMIVDGMAHKYKYKQVRKAAQDAMGFAAAQLGLTAEDLSDRIVPNHGFDRNMERRFDYGTRSFVVRLLPNLKFEIRDDTGKKIKSLPTVGKNDDIDKASSAIAEFKKLKKQMKITVKNQTERLDQAMYTDRRWNVENWKKLFVNNPIMHPFAISLIWGHYKDGNLTEMFRYMEDGTFNTMNEDEYELTEDGTIGLMHPLEMNQETIDVWREQLSDYGITQVVEQLYRPVYVVEDCEKGQNKIERFGGKIVNGLSLAGKLTSLGWKRGTPYDGGFYYCYDRSDIETGYAVELRFSGTNIVLEDTDVTVYDAVIYQLDDNFVEGCAESYFYDREAILDEVSPKYFSEIISQITKATASSIKTDENWRENA